MNRTVTSEMNKITFLYYRQDCGNDNLLVHGFKDQL